MLRMNRAWVSVAILLAVISYFYFPIWNGGVVAYGDLLNYFPNIILEYRKAWQDLNFGWTTGVFNGYPLLGNPQLGFGYVLNLIYLIPGNPIRVLSLYVIIHHAILVVGCYFFFKKMTSNLVAIWGAISVGFMGLTISIISMCNNFVAFSWVPWLCLSIWHICKSEKPNWQSLLGVWAVAYCIFAGGDQQFYVFVIPAILVAPWGWTRKSFTTVLLLLISAQLCQIYNLPFIEMVLRSARAKGEMFSKSSEWNLNIPLLLSIFQHSSMFNELTGFSWGGMNGGQLRQNWLSSLYIGSIASVFAVYAVFITRSKRLIPVYLCVAVFIVMAVSRDGTIAGVDIRHIPLLGMIRYSVRYTVIPFLFIHVAAIYAIENGLNAERLLVKFGLCILAVTGAMQALWISHPFQKAEKLTDYKVWLRFMYTESVIQYVLLALLLLAVLNFSVQWKKYALCVALILDCTYTVLVAKKQLVVLPRIENLSEKMAGELNFSNRYVWPIVYNQMATMENKGSLKTVLQTDSSKLLNLPYLKYEYQAVYDPYQLKSLGIHILSSYIELMPKVPFVFSNIIRENESGRGFNNLVWHFGVTDLLIMLDSSGQTQYGNINARWGHFIRAGNVPFVAMTMPNAMPYFLIFDNVNLKRNYDSLRLVDNTVATVAFTDSVNCLSGSGEKEPKWTRINDADWIVRTGNSRGILGFRQTLYPGWEAFIDGKRVKTFRVNLINQGVCLDRENQVVEFRFRPRFIIGSVVLILFGLGLLIGVLTTVAFSKRTEI